MNSTVMPNEEVAALTAQIRKVTQIMEGNEENEPLTEQQLNEFGIAESLLLSFASHRGSGASMTHEEALELAKAMLELREARERLGVEPPSFEQLQPIADMLWDLPKPAEN